MNTIANTGNIPISEITILGLAAVFAFVWGYRHGLDTVLITALFVVFGRVSADILAVPLGIIIDVIGGFFILIVRGKFSTEALSGLTTNSPLIDVRNPEDPALKLIGTAIFIAICYVGVKFAVKKAGGKDPLIEAVFGAIGAAAMMYLTLAFVINRLFDLPQDITITPVEVPQLTVNLPLILAIIMVLIVFGVQRSRPPAKKK